jgi:multiple antibiotic resistance protein
MFNVQLFLTFFVTLIVITNPIGNVPIFISKTFGMSGSAIRRIAAKAVFFSFLIIVIFALAGGAILSFLDIDISAVQITGGVVLIVLAMQLLLGFDIHGNKSTDSSESEEDRGTDMAIIPFAFPILAGPGTIVAVITQVKSLDEFKVADLGNWLSVFAAVIAVLALIWILFSLSKYISKIFGKVGIDFLTKIFGMLLSAVAISMIGDGIYAFIQSLN